MAEQLSDQKPDILPIRLKNEVKDSIQSTGTFQRDFDSNGITEIVNPMIQNLFKMGGDETKDISFKQTEVVIQNERCSVLANISARGIGIKLGFDLANSQTPGEVRTVRNSENQYFTVSAGLATGVVKGELRKPGKNGNPSAQDTINQVLSNPNKSLMEIFKGDMPEIGDIKIQIKGDVIHLELTGKANDERDSETTDSQPAKVVPKKQIIKPSTIVETPKKVEKDENPFDKLIENLHKVERDMSTANSEWNVYNNSLGDKILNLANPVLKKDFQQAVTSFESSFRALYADYVHLTKGKTLSGMTAFDKQNMTRNRQRWSQLFENLQQMEKAKSVNYSDKMVNLFELSRILGSEASLARDHLK